jgi:transposase
LRIKKDAPSTLPASLLAVRSQRLAKEGDVRVTTAFNRILRLPGASVTGVSFEHEGVVVRVRLRRRRRVCSRCGQLCRATHDSAKRRWRHLDLGSQRCFIECELRRVKCPDCGVRVEAVPFARAGARFTRDFEDVVAFLAQQMAKTPLSCLLRIAWDSVGRIVERVVHDQLDERRLSGLVRIGVDEIAYRRHKRYLTLVCDHRSGDIVWIGLGRGERTLRAFFSELGEEGGRSIKAVSIDMAAGYERAVRAAVPHAQVCFDPFHVVALAGRAVDDVRRSEWRERGKSKTSGGKWVKGVRWSLLKAPERQSEEQLAVLADVQAANRALYRVFLLKEELRMLYQFEHPREAPRLLDAWLSWAQRSRLAPFVKLAKIIREHREGILAAIRLGLSNGRLEGLNSKVRLISHRSFGFHSAAPLIALIYLCCGGITIDLPLR